MSRFNHFISLGEAVAMIVNSVTNDDVDETLDDISTHIDEAEMCLIDDHEEYPEYCTHWTKARAQIQE